MNGDEVRQAMHLTGHSLTVNVTRHEMAMTNTRQLLPRIKGSMQ